MATLRCPTQSGTDDTSSVQLYGGPLAEWLKVGGKHVGLGWREYYQVNIEAERSRWYAVRLARWRWWIEVCLAEKEKRKMKYSR